MKVGLLIPTYLSCLKYIQTALQKFFKEILLRGLSLWSTLDKRVQQKLRDLYLN